MLAPWLLVGLLGPTALGCTDYHLGGKTDGRGPQEDSDPEAVDTSGGESTPADTDTGEVPISDSGEHPDGRIDVALVIDTAYFYDCYRVELPAKTSELINALFDSGADVAVSIGTYDDYNVDGEWWVATGGVPYLMKQQMTTDRATALATAASLEFSWGGDGPGTGYEALLQTLKGTGYDQDCNGRFDSARDIQPFNAGAGDAYGGAITGTADSSVPGTGTINGVGFRGGSKKVVVIFAENSMRDHDYGDEVPTGACLGVTSQTEAVDAITDSDAKFLGINAYEFWDIDTRPQEQLEALASRTSSHIDKDGDGALDDLAVFGGDWNWPATGQIVSAIWDLAQ